MPDVGLGLIDPADGPSGFLGSRHEGRGLIHTYSYDLSMSLERFAKLGCLCYLIQRVKFIKLFCFCGGGGGGRLYMCVCTCSYGHRGLHMYLLMLHFLFFLEAWSFTKTKAH